MKNKLIEMYLDMVFPLCITYLSVSIFYSFTKNGGLNNFILDMAVITILIVGFLYGVLAVIRELKVYGTFETIKYWYNKIKDEIL